MQAACPQRKSRSAPTLTPPERDRWLLAMMLVAEEGYAPQPEGWLEICGPPETGRDLLTSFLYDLKSILSVGTVDLEWTHGGVCRVRMSSGRCSAP